MIKLTRPRREPPGQTRCRLRAAAPLSALALATLLAACGGGGGSDASGAAAAADDAAQSLASAGTTDTAAGAAAATGTISPGGTSGSTRTTTSGVLCGISASEFNSSASVNLTATYSWTCSSTSRVLAGNGVPNHAVGTFPNPNNPNTISAQTVTATYTLTPSIANKTGTSTQIIGYGLNSVKFDPGTGGSCNNAGDSCSLIGGSGTWRIEALSQSTFNFGVDSNSAHVQPTGEYHYHGMPTGLVNKLGGDGAMRLVGWASDGFPIYARKGYVRALDATSGLKTLTGSYRTKATPDTNRPSTSLYAMGTFVQDWEYVAGLGDLDECNGRTGVTPEFPKGIYHYVITDTYPFIQRCVKGTPAAGGGGPPPGPPPGP
jgi:hypothetical protein